MKRRWLLLALTAGCATPASPPAEAPRAGIPAVVEPPSTLDVPLFYAERELLRRAVADHLMRVSQVGLRPLPDLELEVIRAAAMKSKEACAAPTGEDTLLAAKHPDALRVTIHASCAATPCLLRVAVQRPPKDTGPWQTLERWETSVPNPREGRGWIDAVGALALAPPPSGGGLGLLGSVDEGGHPVDVVGIGGPLAFDPPLSEATLEPVRGALDACHTPGWSSAGTDHLAVALARSGAVARCEGISHLEGEGPARMACLCRALQGLKLPPSADADRRLEVRLLNRPMGGPKPPQGAYASLERATRAPGFDPRAALSAHARAVATCAAQAGAAGELEVQVDLQLDGRGQAHAATARAPGAPAGLTACVEAALSQAALPCPPEGAPQTVSAIFKVRAKGAAR
jgi:hypothetical protein